MLIDLLSRYLFVPLSLLLYVWFLSLLIRGHLRHYWFLFAYVLVFLLTTVADLAASNTPVFTGLYYIDDLLRQLMVYALVILLVYDALTERPGKRWAGKWILAGSLALALIFFGIASIGNPRPGWMMTNVVRNLSVTAMVLNLTLWTLLVGMRTTNRQLLLIVSGLGLQMAGEAIGQSLRLLSESLVNVGDLVLFLAHLVCLAVWISAFRRKA
jgi:hypothetical protein